MVTTSRLKRPPGFLYNGDPGLRIWLRRTAMRIPRLHEADLTTTKRHGETLGTTVAPSDHKTSATVRSIFSGRPLDCRTRNGMTRRAE